jgi:hypothetical protein
MAAFWPVSKRFHALILVAWMPIGAFLLMRPCTAVIMGFLHSTFKPKASALPSGMVCGLASGLKNFGISKPAVKLSPSAQSTPAHRSSSFCSTGKC